MTLSTDQTRKRADQRILVLLNHYPWHETGQDVTRNKDNSQVREGNDPQVIEILRTVAFTLLGQRGHQILERAARKLRNQSESVLAMIGLSAAY